jgi:hypothetical protein
MQDMSAINAGFELMHGLADEITKLVNTRARTASSGVYSLAMALGRLCAQLDVDPEYVKECLSHAYKEARRQHQKT